MAVVGDAVQAASIGTPQSQQRRGVKLDTVGVQRDTGLRDAVGVDHSPRNLEPQPRLTGGVFDLDRQHRWKLAARQVLEPDTQLEGAQQRGTIGDAQPQGLDRAPRVVLGRRPQERRGRLAIDLEYEGAVELGVGDQQNVRAAVAFVDGDDAQTCEAIARTLVDHAPREREGGFVRHDMLLSRRDIPCACTDAASIARVVTSVARSAASHPVPSVRTPWLSE